MLSKRFDGALEQRYIWQPTTDSHRNGTALEIGFWPIADARVAVGYNFNDSRDPYGRDLQGRDKGVVPHALDEAVLPLRSVRQQAARGSPKIDHHVKLL